MDAMDRLAHDAANQLQGTCKSIHDLGEEFEAAQNNDIFSRTLDSLVVCCDVCEWWCEISEAHRVGHRFVCDDCFDYSDDDEGDEE